MVLLRPLAPLARLASGPCRLSAACHAATAGPAGEEPAVDRRRCEPFHLRLQAGERVVVHDDPVRIGQLHLAAEATAAAQRQLLEVVHGIAVAADLDFGGLDRFS
jgi:hypothetical protein